MRLLIATHNRGKIREYRELLTDIPLECIGPADIDLDLDVKEDGSTFKENAIIKATAFANASRLFTLADDSGLEVDALDGKPGIHSARYGGPRLSDTDRWRLLLEELKQVPWEKRTARFRCVIAMASASGGVNTVEGTCEGMIGFEAAGEHGFGYDPVFYLPHMKRTMAQLPEEEKNKISHRGQAVCAARPIILEKIKGEKPSW